MVANRTEPGKEAEKPAAGGKPADAKPTKASGEGGGMKAWLPLIITIVTMPALAYAITTFVLVPQLQKGLGISHAAEPASGKKEGGGEKKKAGKEGGGESAKAEMFVMNKILVNVAGTAGARYLLTSFTLAGSDPELRTKIEKREAQLKDLAMGILSTKTINDIEKATFRNLIRSELMSAFNNVLGPDTIQEIYFTEFAIQ